MREAFAARLLWTCLAIAALAAGYQHVGVKGEARSAFNRWRPQLFELARGEDIYLTRAFPTPPIMAAILLPFAKLPPKTGMVAWFAAKALAAALAAVWLARTFAGPRPPAWLAPGGLALAALPVLGDLQHGNVNLLILFLVAAAWGLHRARHDFTAGLATALAAACKVTPGLLAAYFLWRGNWRAAAGVAVGAALWLVLVPGQVFGHGRNLELLASWRATMLKPYVERGEVDANGVNQSLPALVTRLLAPVVPHHWEKEKPVQVNFCAWPPKKVRHAAAWASGAVLAAWLLATRRGLPDAHFCLTLLAMLALSERTWKHHYVLALPAALLLLSAARQRRAYRWPLAFAAGAMLLCSKDLTGTRISDWMQAQGAYLWAAGALAAATWRWSATASRHLGGRWP
jgi:alpha-1,2-mannosyltransferase